MNRWGWQWRTSPVPKPSAVPPRNCNRQDRKTEKIPPWQHRGGIFMISERYGWKVPDGVMSGAFLFI